MPEITLYLSDMEFQDHNNPPSDELVGEEVVGGEGDPEDVDDGEESPTECGEKPKPKKKKKKKKKKKASGTKLPHSRLLCGYTDYYTKYGQTEPPTIPVHELFKDGNFPKGQIMSHGVTRVPDAPVPITGYMKRVGEAERKQLDESVERETLYKNARRAAECHRQVLCLESPPPCCVIAIEWYMKNCISFTF